MTRRWAATMVLVLWALRVAPASAQSVLPPAAGAQEGAIRVALASARSDLPPAAGAEERAIRVEAREVTALYVGAGSLLGTGAILGVAGAIAYPAGDTFGAGIIPLLAAPVVGAFGLALLCVALGYDLGVSHWNGVRARREAGPRRDREERASLGTAITWAYVVGIGVMVVSGAAIPILLMDRSIHAPLYVLPTVVGGLGLFTLLFAAGVQMAVGAWRGFVASVTPMPDGALASVRGTF